MATGCGGFPVSLSGASCHVSCPCCEWEAADPASAAARQAHAEDHVAVLGNLAEADCPEAQYLLAMRLYRGHGTREDPDRSILLLRRAAFLGHPAAQYVMGRSYAQGDGVEHDSRQAVRWYEMAAEQGFGQAVLALADALRDGEGVGPDPSRAADLYDQLARHSRCPLRIEARAARKALAR
jgi:TPR repeat protein